MNLHNILLVIQCYTILGLFVEIWVIFKKWKNNLHGYLFLSCIATLINNIGYLMELTSRSEEAKLMAIKFTYTGGVWISLMLCLFCIRLCKIRIPEIIPKTLFTIHIVIYGFILTTPYHNLYYTVMRYDLTGVFPVLYHGNGILHHIYFALQLIYIFTGMTCLIYTLSKEKNKRAKDRLHIVFLAILTESIFFLISFIDPFGLREIYDVTMLGFFFGTMIMFVAIFSYDLLGTEEVAREFMIDRLSEGIIAADPEGKIQYFNKAAKQMYPELEKESGEVPQEIIQAASEDRNITVGERIFGAEVNDLKRNGVNYGKVYSLVDETDHIRYMKDLEEQKELANSASEAKSRFLANMSHEIRTPINAVLGMDEMIIREAKEQTIRSYASDIMSAGKTLLSLINDILDFSKVEEGKMEIIPVEYELSSLINDLVNMMRDRAAKKGLRFETQIDENTPHILCGDEIRIRQCALNLLSNSVKYTEKGSVILKVSYEKKDDGHIGLCIAVADTGIGMQEEEMEKLFSPYERMEEKRNRGVEGTGLGMSITKQLLNLMGSALKVKSEYGKGTEVSFTLEQEVISWDGIGDYTGRLNETGKIRETYRELFHAPDARILVVDDTEMNLTVMESLLKKTEIKIDTALSGRDAMDLAAVNRYDVIFIDHMMSDMDGIETLRHLREKGSNTDTPAIALTANAVSGARKMYLEAGFTDYVSKPVDGSKLEKLLYVLLADEKIILPAADEGNTEESIASERSKILVVDDDEAVCTLVRNVMDPIYDIQTCLSGEDALKEAKGYHPDLIMLDIHLEDSNGFEVMQQLKGEKQTADIPVLLLTGDNDTVTEENGFKSGASDYIRKPFVPDVLRQRVKRIIDLHHYQQSIEKEVDHQTRRSKRLSREMMQALSKTVDTKDHYTDGHSRRVAALCAEIGRRLGKSTSEQVELYEIGLLHDIGKIGVHEDIIHKNSRLSDDEFVEIKEHTVKGYEILKEINEMPNLREGARWHHERYDGSGYPDGLRGEEIPETARITCVADCYDAMTSTRTYSVPRKQEEVRAEIERCRGKNFDPKIADVMLAMIDEDTEYRMNEKAESGDVWKEYDRLWGNLNDDLSSKASDAGEEIPEWLSHLEDVDAGQGLANCGSAEGYMAVLAVFHRTAAPKADEIEKLYRAGDIGGYTVKVHALKSSARIIGAAELSKLAESLEKAGKEGHTGYISDNTDRLLAMYRDLDRRLGALDAKEETMPGIDRKALKEAYQTIAEIAQSMDYELMEEILASLHGYRLPGEDSDRIAEIEGLLTGLDWDGIIKLAQEALDTAD
jgi:putative nucleotidyltransferase with HDIG domain